MHFMTWKTGLSLIINHELLDLFICVAESFLFEYFIGESIKKKVELRKTHFSSFLILSFDR